MKKIALLAALLTILLVVTGCSKNLTNANSISENQNTAVDNNTLEDDVTSEETENEKSSEAKSTYQTISASVAKEMIDADENVLILDVRTLDEYNEKHIENAVLLPVTSITEEASSFIPDLDTTVLIYCRSGNRSATAAATLVDMGYTNIYDFGGIIDWPYDTITEE